MLQYIAGIAGAVGLTGVTRDGRDVWIGTALIGASAILAMRSIALTERLRKHEASAVVREIRDIGQRLDAEAPAEEHEGPKSRWKRWLDRFGS